MNQKKQIKNWWIDFLLFFGFIMSFYLDLTGVIGHQWLGLAVIILAGIHLMTHWDWVKAVTTRLFKSTPARSRWYYLIDFLLMLGAVIILETGLIISTWFNLSLSNYPAWLDIHIYASLATLALTTVKVGLHWRWVVATTSKVFSPLKAHPVSQPALVPVRVERPLDRDGVDRRHFLSTMGVIGLGSLLAASNIFSDDGVAMAEFVEGGDTSQTILPTATAGQAEVIASTPTTASVTQTSAITLEDGPELTVTATPVAVAQNYSTSLSNSSTACSIRCQRGCSYPGHCRRYTDQNSNGKCDLGECI
jgi:hypothetical protein